MTGHFSRKLGQIFLFLAAYIPRSYYSLLLSRKRENYICTNRVVLYI